MATIYRDEDADLVHLHGRTVAILGYGNQGRSQALNLADSGVDVIVGSPSDASAARAAQDGFEVHSLAEAAQRGDILFFLVPDEAMPDVYEAHVRPALRDGNVLNFASGYNITYGLLDLPATIDVTLLAPRMIGKGVRDTFVDGTGFPSLIAVHQDASGTAWDTVRALAKGIGSTRVGAVTTTFREETVVDLFAEQSGDFFMFRAMFEALTEAGVDPDVALLEMYASGELSQIYAEARDLGLFGQTPLHSRTSQYGQQVVARRHFDMEGTKQAFRNVLADIQSGAFAKEWDDQYTKGLPALSEAIEEARKHPMQLAEDRLYTELGRRQGGIENWLTTEPAGGAAVEE